MDYQAMTTDFIHTLKYYLIEIIPALGIGFFLSGLVHEFIPSHWINRHLGGRGMKGILYSTLIGTLMPVCCWGSLPIAMSFYMRGASLGPVLAILIATPATSINAIIVTGKFFGLKLAAFLFFSVISIGVTAGIVGNMIKVKRRELPDESCECPTCETDEGKSKPQKRGLSQRLLSVLKFAYIDMPKRIGVETAIGLLLAAFISTVTPVGYLVKNYLAGSAGYIFSVIFGLAMYMCATMGVPLVYAFVKQGLAIGPGFTLLLIGPITSYGTILVLKKEFGMKILGIYLSLICVTSVLLGYVYSLIR
ncbi:MAG: permease [Candidatus Omnitrophota bacterium]